MKHIITTMLLALVCMMATAQTFTNPILAGDYPDPSIVRDGEDYYMTHSAFDYQPGLTVWHSKDLVNWEPISAPLNKYLGSVWAPDICKYNGKFYIYFTVAINPRTQFVVTADTPYGPWSKPVDLKVGNIDPCHVVGDDGKRWLFLSGGQRVRLADDGLSIIPGTLEKVYAGWPIPEDWITEGMSLEGPKVRKIGEYYYYLNAEGGTAGPATSHMVVMARSKSIDGPWENSPYNPVIYNYKKENHWWSKGHGSLIDTPDGRWYCVYHAYENSYTDLGRQTLLEPLEMTEDGWFRPVIRDEQGLSADPVAPIAAPLPLVKGNGRYDRLNEFRLGLEWKFYRESEPERLSVKDGVLTFKAKGKTPGESFPLLFVSGEHRYSIEAEIEISDPDTRAGLVLYYDSVFFMGTGFDAHSRLRYRKGIQKGGGKHDAPGVQHLWLRLINDGHTVLGQYSLDGKVWRRETWAMDCSGYNHNTLYQFQSVLPGLFVCGKGEAVFKNFKYVNLDKEEKVFY